MSNIEQKVGIDRLADALSSLATKVKAIKSVDDLKNFASINEFDTQAQDGQLGTYEKDGHPVILLKYAGVPHEFVDREVLEQYVNSQILLVKQDIDLAKQDINIVEEDLDKLTEKVDANTVDINDLASQVQNIENTWKGSQAFGGSNPAAPEIDLKTLTGDKGAFDFTVGKKMLVKITLDKTLYSAEQLMRVGDHSSFHITGRALDGGATTDVSFTLSLNANGILKMNDFHSTGTANQNAFFLRLEIVEQNPKVTAAIDAYTKAEANTKLDAKADKTSVYTKTETDSTLQTKANITLNNITGWVEKELIKWRKGQIFTFKEVQTGTEFENTSLFEKHLIKDGYAIVGGTDGTETTGEVKSHTHLVKEARRVDGQPDGGGDHNANGYNYWNDHGSAPGRHKGTSDATGGPANLAAGVKLLKVAYVAKTTEKETVLVKQPKAHGVHP